MHVLSTPIEYLKGVGPVRSELLKKELRIFTYEDLLMHFPFRYVDKSNIYKISEINDSLTQIQFKGKIVKIEEKGVKRSKRLIAHFQDSSGIIELIWFKSIKWIKQNLSLEKEYIVFGKPSFFSKRASLVHPELDAIEDDSDDFKGLYGVYSTTEKLIQKGLNSRALSKLVKNLIPLIKNNIEENLSKEILDKYKIPAKEDALINIHISKDLKILERAQKRLKFEELFFLQLHLLKTKQLRKVKSKGYALSNIGDMFNEFYNNHLKFPLTNAQKRVLKEIRADVKGNQQMNRLLQGDVGSGKTIVALLSMLMAIDNGFQACIMAPTEILAQQHYKTISEALSKLEININILTGSKKSKKRKTLLEELEEGKINLLIGTHALLEDTVKFNNLGFVVIDEQHRFGVNQRQKLLSKSTNPNLMAMTATPIPRTLAITYNGDMDLSIIDELPKNRPEIHTSYIEKENLSTAFNFIREKVEDGGQTIIVYPLINESEKQDLSAAVESYEYLRDNIFPDIRVGLMHGKLDDEHKNNEMQSFMRGDIDILVSTTVVEVGIDNPNVNVMLINNSERFGLSQLHQLRGRVGRGILESYCLLCSDSESPITKERLSIIVNSRNGFEIADEDLKLRGPGEFFGEKQSGFVKFKIADLITDGPIIRDARMNAFEIIKNDANLTQNNHLMIKQKFDDEYLQLFLKTTVN